MPQARKSLTAASLVVAAIVIAHPFRLLVETFVARPTKNFLRNTGASVTVTRTVKVFDATAPYTLRVHNGGRNNRFEKVFSAVITFGLASNGTTISYYDFFQSGFGVRRFNVGGVGTLQCGGGPCDFSGRDFPEINSQGTLVYSTGGSVFSAATTSANSGNLIANSVMPSIADALSPATNPEILYINAGQVDSTMGGVVDSGNWADVNNVSTIVYVQIVKRY